MHGKKDYLFVHKEDKPGETSTGEKAINIVKSVYAKAGCENNFSYKLYDVPHEFNSEMQQDAYQWLDNQLKV